MIVKGNGGMLAVGMVVGLGPRASQLPPEPEHTAMPNDDPADQKLKTYLKQRRSIRKLLATTPPTQQPLHDALCAAIHGLTILIRQRERELGIVPEWERKGPAKQKAVEP
jgi:hypothetical protein